MSPIAILGFALAMLVLAASPGPGVMATVSRALASGFRPALVVVCGIIFGDLIFLMFALFGLQILAQSLGQLFVVIKIIGAGYLIWQGIKTFFSDYSKPSKESRPVPDYGYLLSGLAITLANPKVILFYCGFLPTFISLADLTAMDIFIVMGVIAGVLFAVLSSYAWLASSAQRLMQSPRRRRILNRSAGAVMVSTGVVIAARN